MEKDVSDIVNRKISEFKEAAFLILSEGKCEILESSLSLRLWKFGNYKEIINVLQELEIIVKSSYNKYRILIKDQNEIETLFSKTSFVPEKAYSYSQKIEHKYLKKQIEFSADTQSLLEDEINMQIAEWEYEWNLMEPSYLLEKFQNILSDSIDLYYSLENLIDKKPFQIEQPEKPTLFDFNQPEPLMPKGNLFGVSKKSKLEFEYAQEDWHRKKLTLKKKNDQLIKEYEARIAKWNDSFDNYVTLQAEKNSKIEMIFSEYDKHCTNESLSTYFGFILKQAFEEPFNKEIGIRFEPESKILKINLELPSIDQFPKIKERTYIKSKSEFKDKYYKQKEIDAFYDNSIYQIILSAIHLVIKHDYNDSINSVNINGWVNSLNKALGKYEVQFIASILVKTTEFNDVDLSLIDAKECFKSFKGVSGSKFSDIIPIKPVLSIDTSDNRFIDAINVAESLDESTNLASMDWGDFEHLIRELFEKEFINNGGEVKVTQASKDGGVDAIAFDKDPIRGGKIVIQAKRYTNLVGIAAVRDLYGTVINEGANKGILITTSNFGADSYIFAKDKPLTLLNGSELLYLLEKHGYKARIDIDEAKKLLHDTFKKEF